MSHPVWDGALEVFRDGPDCLPDWILSHESNWGAVTRDGVIANLQEFGEIRKRWNLTRALFLAALIGIGPINGLEDRIDRPILDLLEATAYDRDALAEMCNVVGDRVKSALRQLSRHSAEFAMRIAQMQATTKVSLTR